MNILILCYQGDVAGSTYSIQVLAKGLADRGHNVYLGCRPESLLFRLIQNSKVVPLPMPFRNKADLKTIWLIRKAVKDHNIDVINPQASRDRYLTALSQWIFGFRPVVVHTRRQRPRSDGGMLQSWFYMKVTDKIVAVSQSVKNQLIGKGIKEHHIKVIYNGTPSEKYKRMDPLQTEGLREKFQIKEGDIVLGCVARPKRQQQLLKALAYIPFPVKVLFVGLPKTPEWETIEKQYNKIHTVYYTGIITPEEALNYYPLFTIKVLPSISEGLSQALLEAMAIGIPVVATAASGNLDLVQDGVNGFLYPNDDAKALAQRIIQLVEHPELREKFIQAGKKTALEDFSLDKTILNYESFFEELLKKKQRNQLVQY